MSKFKEAGQQCECKTEMIKAEKVSVIFCPKCERYFISRWVNIKKLIDEYKEGMK